MLTIISQPEFNAYYNNSSYKKLAANGDHPKVLESEKGDIIRFFYPKKKRFSSNKYKPYAIRFKDNANKLISFDIPAPRIKSLQYYPPLKTHILCYEKLSGEDARSILAADHPLMKNIITFIAHLHQQGIFFRSIHLGNVIIQPDGKLGLIDIADMQFSNKPLSLIKRYRNLIHILLNRDDHNLWNSFGVERFLQIYFQAARYNKFLKFVLNKMILKKINRHSKT